MKRIPDADQWHIPMIDTHFYNWLRSNYTGFLFNAETGGDRTRYLQELEIEKPVPTQDLKLLNNIYSYYSIMRFDYAENK